MSNASAIGEHNAHSEKNNVQTGKGNRPAPGLPLKGRPFRARRNAGRLRILPWQGDRFVAQIAPTRTGRQASSRDILNCLDELGQLGVDRAVTPALSWLEAEPFYQAGFERIERLHLLSASLDKLDVGSAPEDEAAKLRVGMPWHTNAVLDVDRQAFEGFWRFDQKALSESKSATPHRRFKVAKQDGRIVGYTVTGRARNRGYLQRLAVDPSAQGQGIGGLLVWDSFLWLKRRGVSECMVNTQESNHRALDLYERLGFRLQSQGLVVLRWNRNG